MDTFEAAEEVLLYYADISQGGTFCRAADLLVPLWRLQPKSSPVLHFLDHALLHLRWASYTPSYTSSKEGMIRRFTAVNYREKSAPKHNLLGSSSRPTENTHAPMRTHASPFMTFLPKKVLSKTSKRMNHISPTQTPCRVKKQQSAHPSNFMCSHEATAPPMYALILNCVTSPSCACFQPQAQASM